MPPISHQTIHLLQHCSTDEFLIYSYAPSTHPIKRGCKHRFISKDAREKVREILRCRTLESSIKKESHKILFVATFNPALPNIRQVKSTLTFFVLHNDTKQHFLLPLVYHAYRRCKDLRKNLHTMLLKWETGNGKLKWGGGEGNRGQRSFGVTFEHDLSLRFFR